MNNNKTYLQEVSCNLCGSVKRKLIRIENSLPISKCLDCSLVYVSAYPKREAGEDVKDFTDNSQIDWNKNKYENVIEKNLDYLNRLVPAKGKMLDVGCGFGFFINRAQQSGWDTFGLDVSDFALNYAEKELKLPNLKKGELNQAGYEKNFFNAVTMWNVLEHVPNPSEVLKDIYQILIPGGLVAIRVPNVAFHKMVLKSQSVFRRMKIKIYDYDLSYIAAPPPHHLFGYSPATLKKFLINNGFKVHKIAPAYISNFVSENKLYPIVKSSTDLLYNASLGSINFSPTITAWAFKK